MGLRKGVGVAGHGACLPSHLFDIHDKGVGKGKEGGGRACFIVGSVFKVKRSGSLIGM